MTQNNARNKEYKEYDVNGVTLYLKPFNPMLYQRWERAWKKRNPPPKPPKKELTFAGGKTDLVDDVDNEHYQEKKADWESELLSDQLDFAIKQCVSNEPPEDYVVPDFAGDNTLDNRRVYWVLELLGTQDEFVRFFNAVVGQMGISEEEIAEEIDNFRSHSGPPTGNEIQDQGQENATDPV